MPKLIRTFIAIAIPTTPELRRVIADLEAMGSALKPVSADSLHITLKFLGDSPSDRIPAITEIMKSVAAVHRPFSIEATGLGAFPRIERPTVIWAGVSGGEPLIAMAAELEDRLMDLGFEPESRAFTPHLTLARVRRKPPEELFALFKQHEQTDFATIPVSALTLFESRLTPNGPIYRDLASTELHGP